MSNPTSTTGPTPTKKTAAKKVARPRKITTAKPAAARKATAPQARTHSPLPGTAMTPSPQTNQSATNAEIDARSTKHAAWVAAGAAILAALLALGGTLWSAHLSAKASDKAAQTAADAAVKTVSVQLSGETEKSRAEFLRGQRITLYSTIIADDIALHEAERHTYTELMKTPKSKKIKSIDRVNKQLAKLNQDRPTAEIIASLPVRNALAALYEVHGREAAQLTLMSFRDRKSGDPEKFSAIELDRQRSFDNFCEVARKDMGSE
jgi:hypothetical protein